MLNITYKREDNVVARNIAGEDILVPIRGSLADMHKLYIQEGIGEFIWNRIDGEKNLANICDEIVSKFNIERTKAEQDLLEFIEALKEAELITLTS